MQLRTQCSVLDFQLQTAGLKLPSEELIGQQPSPCQKLDRAYMSNVCTAKAAQRQVQEPTASCNKAFSYAIYAQLTSSVLLALLYRVWPLS